MATTATPISAAKILPFHTKLRLLSSLLSSRSPSFVLKCSNPLNINGINDTKASKLDKNGGGLKNMPVEERIDELLNRDEIRALVDELHKQETEARKMMEHINHLETRVSEIAQVQKQISEARAIMMEANHDAMMMMTETERKTMNKNNEKLESIKAASISAIVGTLASLPISLTHFTNTYELTVSTAITMITCALYGATYRYTIRRDLDDFHLKNGTSAAFGIVKGVATLDRHPVLEQDAFSGAVCVSENILIFLIAAAGLDVCYKMGILSPFPVDRPVSKAKM